MCTPHSRSVGGGNTPFYVKPQKKKMKKKKKGWKVGSDGCYHPSTLLINDTNTREDFRNPIPGESSSLVTGPLLDNAATLRYFPVDIFSINSQRISVSASVVKDGQERTHINEEQRETLKSFFKEGMARVGSPLIPIAASATGLDTIVIENWIGNYKRSFKALSEPRQSKAKVHIRELSPYNLFCRDILRNKGTMNDIKGKWSTLGKDEKHKYCQEAAALRAHEAQDLSPEMRDLRIKMHLKKLKFEVSKLEALGVETAILSFDRQKSSLQVYELGSKGATDFLDSTDTVNNFALHFRASSSAATPSTKGKVNVLVGKVQDLFNQKYKEAGGTGRLPYQSLVNQGMIIKVTGLPNSLTLKKPSFYGRNQLEAILKVAEEISFEINAAQCNPTDTAEVKSEHMDAEGAQQMKEESSETAITSQRDDCR